MLGVARGPVSKTEDVTDVDGEVGLGEVLSVSNRESEPLVVDELDGFERVSGAVVLGDVISWSRGSSVNPLSCPFNVGWEVVPFPLGYQKGEVSVENYCDLFRISHSVCFGDSGSVVGFLRKGQEVIWELVLMSSSGGNSGLHNLCQ